MSLEQVHSQIVSCTKCSLHENRTNAVPGEGNRNAKIFFVGEAPGRNEDLTGKPFVGSAGKILTQLLEENGFSRENVFITSILKCRPPKNRNPHQNEIKACSPYLTRQINLIKPKLLVSLGQTALSFFSKNSKLSEKRGTLFDFENFKVFSTYHPAAVIYNRTLLSELKKDFKKISKLVV